MSLLNVKNLYFSFGGLQVTNNINLEVDSNQVVALIGPNGSGKTTLFNQITGIYRPNSGAIIFDGKHIEKLKPYQICECGLARTYQIINLFGNMTVIDNVVVGMHTKIKTSFFDSLLNNNKNKTLEKNSKNKARELLKLVDLENNEYDAASSLPYGKQRLLEIVRALACEPKLVLLDEPAAGMNETEKEKLNKLIRKIVKMGISVLIVEHDMKLIMDIADKIYVIESGNNLACGTPKEIQNNQDVIRAYLGE